MAIAPDLGERYLDTVYQTNWLEDLFGKDVLDPVRAGQQFLEGLSRSADAGAATLAGRRPISTATEAVLKATGQGLGLPQTGSSSPCRPPRPGCCTGTVRNRCGCVTCPRRPASSPRWRAWAPRRTTSSPGTLLRQTNRRLSGPTTRSQRYP